MQQVMSYLPNGWTLRITDLETGQYYQQKEGLTIVNDSDATQSRGNSRMP